MNEKVVRARVLISGRVQGVFFRHEASMRAKALGLSGWVRNLSDGRVEGEFEGTMPAVESMISWAHRGPSHAHVEAVNVEWLQPAGEQGFSVR